MAELDRIRVYPVKALDGVDLEAVSVTPDGRIEYDREYAMFDADGEYVNGRQNRRVHRLSSEFDVETRTLAVEDREDDGSRRRFELGTSEGRTEVGEWLSAFFGEPVTVERAEGTFTDSAGGLAPLKLAAPGPTIVSTATLEAVASWYPDLGVEDVRRRLRANLEVAGTEPFWEDRLSTDEDHVVSARIGEVTLHGVMVKPRCVTPTRDPDTGEVHEDFVETFVERREASFPEWADPRELGVNIEADVEGYYYLTVVTRLPQSAAGRELAVGDEVEVIGERPLKQVL